jgi:hypothetical protein
MWEVGTESRMRPSKYRLAATNFRKPKITQQIFRYISRVELRSDRGRNIENLHKFYFILLSKIFFLIVPIFTKLACYRHYV